jgi:hypothetical protein
VITNIILLLAFSVGLYGPPAHAREISTAFISFNLPDNNWDCKLDGTEWVCRSRIEKSAQEAVIVFTAKEAGPADTLGSYARHLATRQNQAARGGGALSTIIMPVRPTIINGQEWVDATHRDSEIKNYFTRYLATVKDGIAVAVTFTAHKDSWTKYTMDFFSAASSIKVIAAKTMIGQKSEVHVPGGSRINIPGGNTEMVPDPPMPTSIDVKRPGGQKAKAVLFLVAVALAAGALYVLVRSRKD